MIHKILWQLRNNLVVQFSLTSIVVMIAVAIFLSTMLSTRLSHNVELIEQHGQAMMSGAMIDPSEPFSISSITNDVKSLRLVIYGVTAGSFVVLYGALIMIVARGWSTIQRQQQVVNKTRDELRKSPIPVVVGTTDESRSEHSKMTVNREGATLANQNRGVV